MAKEVRELVRRMSIANPFWGSPRIVGELAKLGLSIATATVEKYMGSNEEAAVADVGAPSSRTHVKDLVAVDFFVVPTVAFKVLFDFVVLAHARRRVVHFNVTEHPTAQWTTQQIWEAFPWEAAPRYLVRDRDGVYGRSLQDCIESLGIEQVLTAPRSPWQNPFADRVMGSIRRECLEHVIVLNERHLRRLLADYFEHYKWESQCFTSVCA